MDSLTFLLSSREINRYGIAASLAVLFYDYALTLELEIKLFWARSSPTWPSFFFFLARYSALIIHIPIAVEFFHPNLSFELIRTHALYGQSFRILMILLFLSAAAIGIGSWAFVASRQQPGPSSHVAPTGTQICAIPMSDIQGKCTQLLNMFAGLSQHSPQISPSHGLPP
ncbi:hypothetical protein QCA50_013731 [Cerrena zonata]|uniref:DUF6533 domain-containing protein n=1 Tax=Cerrena zonata TaxID=2478898 RepID=A0AAW0FVF5_9APHY